MKPGFSSGLRHPQITIEDRMRHTITEAQKWAIGV